MLQKVKIIKFIGYQLIVYLHFNGFYISQGYISILKLYNKLYNHLKQTVGADIEFPRKGPW